MRNEDVILKAKQFCADNGINEYPVKIVNICNNLGLSVFEEYLDPDISGLIVVDDKQWPKYEADKFIVVNLHESPERRRFTVAHELAHYVLHRNRDVLYAHRDINENGLVPKRIEVEANYFATNILMPEELINERVYDLKLWGKVTKSMLINDIAQSFLVSQKAAEVRLRQLELI